MPGDAVITSRLPTEERQAEIVAAALSLAREHSPALITSADIAAEVGVSQGALFKHFPTKDAIWVAAMAWVRERLLASLAEASQAAEPGLAGLRALFEAHVGFVSEHPGVPRFIFHELQKPADSAPKQEVRALLQAYRKLLLAQLGQAAERGQLAAGLDQQAAATLFIGIIQGLVMQSMLNGKPAINSAEAARVFALYLRGIGEAP